MGLRIGGISGVDLGGTSASCAYGAGKQQGGIAGSHNEQEAERRIAGALKALKIDSSDLPKLPKGSAKKIAIASVVKRQTAVTNAWLAEWLHMGAATRVSSYCGEQNLTEEIKKLVKKI